MSEYMSVDQVAQKLEFHRNTVIAWIESGKLPATKPGNRWRVARSDLDAMLEKSSNKEQVNES